MTPKRITDALEKAFGYSGSVRQLRDAIEDVLLTRFGQPVTTSAELSEGLCHKVAEEIEARALVAEKLGTITVISLRNHREAVHGSLLMFPDDDPSTVSVKISRLQSRRIFLAIQSLSFYEFERFGRAVLRELGCPSPMVTKRSGDQGIDFYGEVSIGQLPKKKHQSPRPTCTRG